MKLHNIRKIILFFIISISLCSCNSTSSEEIAKIDQITKLYKDDIKDFINRYYGEEVKIKKIYGDYITKFDSLGFSSENYASKNVNVKAKYKDNVFDIRYYSDTDTYKTNKNEKHIEESLRDYITESIGKDLILYMNFYYGTDPEYYDEQNMVDLTVANFEQVYDNNNIVFIECFLHDTDLSDLKDKHSLEKLEKVIDEGSNGNGQMGALLINLDNNKDLSEKELNSMYTYLKTSADTCSVTVDDVVNKALEFTYYSYDRHELVHYSADYPNNTYSIKKDMDLNKLISVVY